MMTKDNRPPPLSTELRPLLEEIVRKYNGSLAALVQADQLEQLTKGDYEAVRLSLGNELCETGLEPNDEPNGRGYQIEDLIGWIGRRIRWIERDLHPSS